MSTSVSHNPTHDDTAASPTKKRVQMANFMTPVRRILYRLEWSKSTQKRRGKLVKQSHKTKSPTTTGQRSRARGSSRHPSLSALPSLTHKGVPYPPPVTADHPPAYRTRAPSPIVPESSVAPAVSSDIDDDGSHSDIEITTPTAHSHRETVLSSPTPTKRRGPSSSRVAIQQEDTSLDAIVVTTLPTHPFSCHEYLLAMSRTELIAVAQALNARLPRRNQIPVGEGVLEAVVRSEIEVLVGIRPPVPMAPRAVKCVQSLSVAMDVDSADDVGGGEEGKGVRGVMPSPPSSPLAMREKRRNGAGHVGLGLGRLGKAPAVLGSRSQPYHEEEGDAMDATSLPLISPRRFLERLEELPEPDSDVDGNAYVSESNSEDDCQEDSDTESALADPSNTHVMKKRRVSQEGDYASILAVEPKRTPRLVFPSSSKFSPLHATPTFAASSIRYKFSIPRKPVQTPYSPRNDLDSGGGTMGTTGVVHSDSIDLLFQGAKTALDAGSSLVSP